MDERAKAIAIDIESGEYFSEAKAWYNKVFVYQIKPYVMMNIIGYVMLVIAAIMAIEIYQVFPLAHKVNIIARINDTAKFYPKLLVPRDKNKTTRQFVVEALAARYVVSREGYIPDRFKINYLFLLKSSSKDIFDSYYKYITSQAPDTPSSLYRKHFVARINVIDVVSDPNANKVTITFNKDMFNIFGAFQSSSSLKADIEFYLSKYNFDESKNAKLDFIVTKYIVSQVEKE